jgi:hypothetical protein
MDSLVLRHPIICTENNVRSFISVLSFLVWPNNHFSKVAIETFSLPYTISPITGVGYFLVDCDIGKHARKRQRMKKEPLEIRTAGGFLHLFSYLHTWAGTNQTLRESLVSDIPTGGRKNDKLFYSVWYKDGPRNTGRTLPS